MQWRTWAAVVAVTTVLGPAGGCDSAKSASADAAVVDPAAELFRIQAVQFLREKEREKTAIRNRGYSEQATSESLALIEAEQEYVTEVLRRLNESHPSQINSEHALKLTGLMFFREAEKRGMQLDDEEERWKKEVKQITP